MSNPATLTTAQQVPVSIAFLDANGVPAKVTGITMSPSDTAVILPVFGAPYDPTVPVDTLDVIVQGAAAGTASLIVVGINPDGSSVSGSQEFVVSAVPQVLPASQIVFTVGSPVPKV